jgi:hypothetical protein
MIKDEAIEYLKEKASQYTYRISVIIVNPDGERIEKDFDSGWNR